MKPLAKQLSMMQMQLQDRRKPHLKGSPINVDSQICEINAKRDRLRTGHFRRMKIHKGETRSYRPCRNCPDTPLTLERVLVGFY
ncbi:hypothetical protein TNIN_163221 [Trichonephila inaurata madagascariensis]|uniref:Uncharacterized protein n=1 Tax=Trichonephila inaurata madagascariensis TaxID=2747483 RepID=A0A8X6IRM7_9ARAC|nr:hypothetical protein TNIN_163221 [Trichonephila inaurata madagascariensis]